ncbi:MAG: hypothetical protein OHK0023_27130 [Anaerolineae bacterium]
MAAQTYLDFELNIEALSPDQLRVTLANSPVGSSSVDVPTPVTEADIKQVIGVLDGSQRVTRSEAARTARAFGEKLFSGIFTGQIYAAYLASRAQAGNNGLRIRLNLDKAGELDRLPWELLRDPNNDYLALSRATPIIRYPRLINVRPPLEISLPLRVLVLISSPKDQEPLNVEAEWQSLLDATETLRKRGLLEIDRVDDAQLVNLQRKLREGTSYQVFHYIGHAAFDERSQQGMLAFEDPRSDKTQAVSGEALARELVEENSIRLVVLNACHGARQNSLDPFSGIASSIVARGIPCVVAMQFAITDDASRIFSSEFYRTLSEGYPIEGAIAEARRAIASTLNNQEWATPVLVLRAANGILFPKRTTITAPVSRGGLIEALQRPPVLIGVAGVIAVFIILFSAIFNRSTVDINATNTAIAASTPTPAISTLTPTPNTPRDVDLIVDSVRLLPVNPAPGQPVVVAIRIQNNGTSDSGAFKWAWFASENALNQGLPGLQGTVDNLGPGLNLTVRGTVTFGWWGDFRTTAWVNFDNEATETNPLNNIQPRTVRTSTSDFAVDFSILPDGNFLEAGPLAADAFNAWSFEIAPDAGDNTSCANAVTMVRIVEDRPRISVQGADDPSLCRSTPIRIGLIQPSETDFVAQSVSIDFLPSAVGSYTLETVDGSNLVLATQTLEIDNDKVNQTQSITIPINGARGIVFRPPQNALTVITRLVRKLS